MTVNPQRTGASVAAPGAGVAGVRPGPGSRPPSQLRADIQGLRALAVLLVVVYHLNPKWLSGGFIGVDVFFVISGFLITFHLVQRPPTGLRDLATFWGRRIRRLLPASLLVLGVTLVASRAITPETQWANTARQVRAAALYVGNWLLAGDAVDYLAAENAPSPVQHFWSLSVEEQFYFVWPVLILAMVLLARRRRWNVDVVVFAGLATLVSVSLLYSVWETATNPAAAYFVTPTRMWELGIGGLLALAVAARQRRHQLLVLARPARVFLAWTGLALIMWAAWTYTGQTPFPGWQALAPVLGTAFVIAARPPVDSATSPGKWLAVPPAQWLGDVSYSVYLWHWPLVILVPAFLGHPLGNLNRLAVLLSTLLLGWLTKEYVEDRFRTPQWGRPLGKPFLMGVAAMAAVVGMTAVQSYELDRRAEAADAALAEAIERGGPCFGARALDHPERCDPVPFDEIVPAPADALGDKAEAYGDVSGDKDCWSYLPRFPQVHCHFGAQDSRTHVALVGNSHAGQWLPALQAVAERRDWAVDTYLASRCASAPVRQKFATEPHSRACTTWGKDTVERLIADRPDVVVMSNRISLPAYGETLRSSYDAYLAAYEDVLRKLSEANLKVLVLHDTPASGMRTPDCVAENPDDVSKCDGPRVKWLRRDPAGPAVERTQDPDIRFVDLNDHICDQQTCHAVTGGVITYFDASHLTATYARTLAGYLDQPLAALING